MRKLKLSLEDLHVESFTPDARDAEEGTVHGRETFMPGSCWPDCSADTLCVAGPCETDDRTCGTCLDPQYVSQCGASCFEVC